METNKAVMTDILEELLVKELKDFTWQLWNGVGPDIKPIPRGKLEKTDHRDVVDCMVQQYSTDAGTVAVRALRNIKQNDLANRLELNLQKVQQPVREEARNAPVYVEPPIQSDWVRPYRITACSQDFKQRILGERGDDIYMPARSQRKGSALLITNIIFDYKEYNRNGAERDEANMEWLLTALGYSVEKHTNLSGDEIDRAVESFSKRSEHQSSDSTFVVIMSHGGRINNRDAILGIHYHEMLNPNDFYFIDKTFSHLNSENCSALINKPKVILIQACRGDIEKRKGHLGGVYAHDSMFESDAWIHREKDFVCFMSTLPDTVSYRDPNNGSFFIMYIVDVFSKCARNDEILELIRKVTSRMENDPRFTREEQILPCMERTSLTRKFYLFPGL